MGGDQRLDFELSEEVLSMDSLGQLDVARKIASVAMASMDSEVLELRKKLRDKECIVHRLERDCCEADSRLKKVLDDNMNLTKEKDSLAMTVTKLTRDLAKLETVKQLFIKYLSNESGQQTEPVDIQSGPGKDGKTNAHSINHSYSGSADTNHPIVEASKYTATPKNISTSVSPRGYSAAGGAVSPTAANSPPRNHSARTPQIDGQEFLRQARSRLSDEQFSSFLANVKELNAQKQTQAETLRKADEIFGEDNKDLYLSFLGLLNSFLGLLDRNMR